MDSFRYSLVFYCLLVAAVAVIQMAINCPSDITPNAPLLIVSGVHLIAAAILLVKER